MSDKLVSLYAIDDMLSKLSGMYHIEDIRGMISRMPGAEVEDKKLEWISTGERLPPKDKEVLFLCSIHSGYPSPRDAIYTGMRTGDAIPIYYIRVGGTLYKMDRDILGTVMYWLQIPELPENNEGPMREMQYVL